MGTSVLGTAPGGGQRGQGLGGSEVCGLCRGAPLRGRAQLASVGSSGAKETGPLWPSSLEAEERCSGPWRASSVVPREPHRSIQMLACDVTVTLGW